MCFSAVSVVCWTHSRGLGGGSGGAVLFAVHSCARRAPAKDVIDLRDAQEGHFLTVRHENNSSVTKNSYNAIELTFRT